MKRRHVTLVGLALAAPVAHPGPVAVESEPSAFRFVAPRPSPSEVPTTEARPESSPTPPEGAGTDRGGPPEPAAADLGRFMVTCYVLRGETATGTEAGPGTIAVDPSTIRLGTHLAVAGYGPGVAADTGGAIKGRHIDVWLASESACIDFGVRYLDVKVAA